MPRFIDSEMIYTVFYRKFILPVSLVSELSHFAFPDLIRYP